MRSIKHFVLVLLVVSTTSLATADELSGATSLLCSPWQVHHCPLDEPCTVGSPSKLNVPLFIVVDLNAKELRTTEASGENRATQIKHLERENGLITLQGVEMGRAFSFVISEETGMLSIGVALDGGGVVGFGACTPTPDK
jgi:hypothetical protein